jgi:putative endonuclease
VVGYVYLLYSLKDFKKYIGSTNNLSRRYTEHKKGNVTSTKNRRPLVLVAYQEFDDIKLAAKYEKKYKNSSGHLQRMIKSGKFKIRDN